MKFILGTFLAVIFAHGAMSSLNEDQNDSVDEAAKKKYTSFAESKYWIKPLPLAPPGNNTASEGIEFEGTIGFCDARPNFGSVPFRSLGNPDVWDYWAIDLQAGREVSFEGNRESCGMDPAFYLFFNTGVIVGSGDDELAPPTSCPTSAPFRDPQLNITALPFTGKYVVGLFDNAGEPAVVDGSEEKEGRYKLRVSSPDRDGDGIGEACDKCPFTKLVGKIDVTGCETGVQDKYGDDGCSISDFLPGVLKECEKKATARGEGPNGRKFTSCVNIRLRKIRKDTGTLTKTDQRKIMKCVPKANFEEIRNTCGNRFFASDKDNLFIIDPESGGKQFVGRLPTCSAEIQYDDDRGEIWNEKCGGSELSRVNGQDASLIDTLPGHLRGPVSGMELVGGVLYGTHVERKKKPRLSRLVKINKRNADFEIIGDTGKDSIPGLAYDKKNGIMWGITGGNSPAELLKIDLKTGKADISSIVRPVYDQTLELNNIGSLDFGPNGELYAGINERASIWPSSLIWIDRNNGVAKRVGNSEVGYRGLACYTL